jgi:hypothetical protein
MARSKPYSMRDLAVMLATLVTAVAMIAACGPIVREHPQPIDVTTVAPCPGESGPAMGDTEPCVWDTTNTPARFTPSAHWILYADTCPVDTVQVSRQVVCVPRSKWGE